MQVNVEKKFESSIKSENKRNKKDFKNLISQFLKDNFHFVAQKYLIFLLLRDVIQDLSEKLNLNLTLKLENFLQSKDVQDDYRNIYLSIFENFEKTINQYRDMNGNIYN